VKNLKNLRFNIQSDNPNLNDFLIVSESMGRIPNRTLIHDTFSGKDFEDLVYQRVIENKITFSEIVPIDQEYHVNERTLLKLNNDLWCSYTKINSTSDGFSVSDVCIYFGKNDNAVDLIEEIKKCSMDFENDEYAKINNLLISNGILEIDPIIPDQYLDISIYHPKENIKNIKKILKSIKSKNRTLSIMRGPRGCGKTHILKWGLSELDIISIFIPNNMIDHTINNPEFRNFLKRFEKCVLVLDDSEFNYGYSKSFYLSGNLIQILDSMSNIHVIMVFNVNKEYEIDEDILECNNLENNHYFGLLDSEFASKLSKEIGHNKTYQNKTSISDVIDNKKHRQTKSIGLK
jgi:hypothetical protein